MNVGYEYSPNGRAIFEELNSEQRHLRIPLLAVA